MGFLDDIPTVSSSRNRKGSATPKPVIYRVIICPVCKCRNCPVTSSPQPKKGDEYRVRYHQCTDCRHTFKSLEQL